MAEIVQKGAPVLRQIAKEVPLAEIQTPHIKKIISDMKKALAREEDGVAIAAPQIGELWRIFVISHKAFSHDAERKNKKVGFDPEKQYDVVCINPKIVSLSKKKKKIPEGCLSVRHFYGNVERASKATIRAYNEKGELFERGGSDLIAQIFQHETDHLDGILFIDKAEDIEEIKDVKP